MHLLVWLALAAATATQPGGNESGARATSLGGAIGPDQLKALQGRMLRLRAADKKPELLNDLLKFAAENPGVDPKELAERFLARNPGLRDNPERLRDLQELAKSLPGAPSAPRPGPARPESPAAEGPQPGRGADAEPPPPPRQATPPGSLGRAPRAARELDRLGDAPVVTMAPDADGGAVNPDAEQVRAALRWYEKNVGSLDKSPAMRQFIRDLITGPNSGRGGDGAAGGKGGVLKQLIELGRTKDGKKFSEWLGGQFSPDDLPLDALKSLGQRDFGLGGGGGQFSGSLAAPSGLGPLGNASLWPLAALLTVLVLGFAYYRRGGAIPGLGRRRRAGLAGWGGALPARLESRDDLVAAVELVCLKRFGAPARPWHHRRVAESLEALGAADSGAVRELAALYARARYAPPADEFPASDLPGALDTLRRLDRAAVAA